MPVTKSAKKALRQDRRRAKINRTVLLQLKKVVTKARRTKTPAVLASAYQLLDRAVKKGVIHKNKAARIKSSLTSHAQKRN